VKIRQGFVSNSSSSSFCIITTKEDYKKALSSITKKHDENVAKLLEYILGRADNEFTFKGAKGIVLAGTIYSESYSDAAYNIVGDNEDMAYELADKASCSMVDLFNEIEKLGGYATKN